MRLRLGNLRYPHMKLQIQPWPNEAGFMLSVNTHDQVLAIDPASSNAQAFRDLQAENQRLKEAIEAAWDEAGLPTFLSYLRRYIEDRAGAAPRGSPTCRASGARAGVGFAVSANPIAIRGSDRGGGDGAGLDSGG